ncbi:WD40-repeat-containing domain protein [Geopyxis carbonaria]|nr:WD40-repeat-containing domain protein [Geopyxis carbonaria]
MQEDDYRISTFYNSEGSNTARMNSRPSQLSGLHGRQENIPHSHPRPLPTPTRPIVSPLQNLLPSAPASPPTPAPSPTPQIHRVPTWSTANENEDTFLRDARPHFSRLDSQERQRFLAEILNLCDSQQLSFVLNYVSPRLKKDPFKSLPNELCLRVLSFIDDPKTLARASQVSKQWHSLLSDDLTWKKLCEKHSYRRLSGTASLGTPTAAHDPNLFSNNPVSPKDTPFSSVIPSCTGFTSEITPQAIRSRSRRPKATSYKSHFKQRYMVETAWRTGGKAIARHITPDQGVVTSLHLTPDYIVIALDNAKIHVFDADGQILKTLTGHVMGVWAMVPWGKTLVSGGCDRDVRVWDMETGECKSILRGHTSTVRCLKMSDRYTAISGSRDTTLRIWDIEKGVCKNVLVGHQASVRCLEIHGDLVVSGSYDTTARVWSISQGTCLRTLSGHFSQIYAIAFDGIRIATGSLDTSVRIWDPHTGTCLAVLQGHTSLVGQLQMRGNTLVTGGSDGSVRVWSLEKNACVHRLAAHDNSVTSLQFDETRIVSGGSDGRVKVWDLRTGTQVRELSSPAQAVWRVAFEEEKAVILASRADRTIMEVFSFSPPPEALNEYYQSSSPSSERSSGDFDPEHDTVMDDEGAFCGMET